MNRLAAAALGFAALTFLASDVEAAPPFVQRPATLPRHDFAGDVGIGIGHVRTGLPSDVTGAGFNLEGAFGITERFELGLRTGIRLGPDGKATRADFYGRTLWTETYGTRFDTFANPEFRLKWTAYRGDVVEISLDGRVYTPIELGSRFGGMFGVPFAFHLGDIARIDVGPYLLTLFHDPAFLYVNVPAYFWFQVTEKVWLGPMTSARFRLAPGGGDRTNFLVGFGVGIQVASAVDLKTMLLFPNVGDGADAFGAGFGVQFRIE